jgi:hypothetical protein
MPSTTHSSDSSEVAPSQTESGVSPMTKFITRNKYFHALFVLAVLALSSGAGVKWYG